MLAICACIGSEITQAYYYVLYEAKHLETTRYTGLSVKDCRDRGGSCSRCIDRTWRYEHMCTVTMVSVKSSLDDLITAEAREHRQ